MHPLDSQWGSQPRSFPLTCQRGVGNDAGGETRKIQARPQHTTRQLSRKIPPALTIFLKERFFFEGGSEKNKPGNYILGSSPALFDRFSLPRSLLTCSDPRGTGTGPFRFCSIDSTTEGLSRSSAFGYGRRKEPKRLLTFHHHLSALSVNPTHEQSWL